MLTRSEQERVAAARVARLATIDDDGRPHLVPICFVLAGGTLYSAVDRKPKRSTKLRRLANVRARPQATVLVDEYHDDWSQLWWVRLRCQARVLEDGAERDHALALLATKYSQYREQLPTGPVLALDTGCVISRNGRRIVASPLVVYEPVEVVVRGCRGARAVGERGATAAGPGDS